MPVNHKPRRSAELAPRRLHRSQGEGDGRAPDGEGPAYDRDQDDLRRVLMRRALGAALTGAALFACRPTAPSGLTLLFLGRAPAAPLDGLSWAPDPDASSIAAFDRDLRVVKRFTSPRLAPPPAVAPLGGRYLPLPE